MIVPFEYIGFVACVVGVNVRRVGVNGDHMHIFADMWSAPQGSACPAVEVNAADIIRIDRASLGVDPDSFTLEVVPTARIGYQSWGRPEP